jgi:cellulose synthase/poly-beta-1,6-N-acetylglucosamine synthase-like glycosyltransferase
MIDFALGVFWLFGALCFYFGLVSLAYYPLVLAYPFWERRLRAKPMTALPRVSVLAPAYNEERTLAASLASILASDYPDFEVIVVNDGSTDATAEVAQRFLADPHLRYFAQPNGGKASALNLGLEHATGEIVLFTDADSLFEPATIRNGVSYFADPSVGAVSGDDTPLHPRGPLQKMLVVTSHIGTGFVRRALSMLGILQIIPGNLGLIRTAILRRLGGFREVWGEDLEITLRLHREGVRVVYGAAARVRAECPHTVAGLWKQRVRWLRSYIKVLRLHRDMVGNPRYGLFGPFLLFNGINMVLVPLLQLVGLVFLPLALWYEAVRLAGFEWIAYLGLGFLFAAASVAMLLDRSPRDLRYLPYGLLLLLFSHFYNVVVLYSLWAEARTHAEHWNKLERRDLSRLSHTPRWPLAAGALALVVVLAFVGGYWLGERRPAAPPAVYASLPQAGSMAVAIHFDAWHDWRDAYRTLLARPEVQYVNRVAVSAGRADWTYFRWPGQQTWWAPEQQRAEADMLESAVAELAARGFRTTAILDVYASRWLERHPEQAALDVDGQRSREVVCSTVLAEGEYGRHLLSATAALAAHTRADSVALTELFYDRHCYDDRCLAAFRRATGRDDWPRTARGRIDRLDPAIGAWRSRQVASVVERASRAVHAHGKQLYMDVKLSRGSLQHNAVEAGQDYALLAPWVDRFVVWDYFAIEGLAPESSARAAAYFDDEFGAERFYLSIGLWKTRGYIDADELARALAAARAGGAEQIWVTPAKALDDAHWRAIRDAARVDQGASLNGR